MDMTKSLAISAAGMRAQGARLRIISENLANANSTAPTPDDLPYRRQTIAFRNVFDREMGANMVRIANVGRDPTEFRREYQPGHPSADPEGYVLMPNVNLLVEMMDMREAQRSYEANLNVVELSKSMVMRTIDLLRA